MGLVCAGDVDVTDAQAIGQHMRLYGRMIALPSFKGVGEALLQEFERLAAGIARDGRAAMVVKLAYVIDAMTVIGMIVGPENGVDMDDIGGQQLDAHVGGRIDKEARCGAFHQDRGPCPPVLRLGGITASPVIADPGDAR